MSLVLRGEAIAAGVAVYLFWALLASALIRRSGRDLSQMQSRSSSGVLLLGAAANLLVLASVLALCAFLLGQPVAALGLQAGASDLALSLIAAALTFGSALGFLAATRGGRVRVALSRPSALLLALAVLAVVAAQEETLFRGYLVLALAGASPALIITVTTLVFVLIHLPTNRASLPQVLSWVVGGVVLIVAYLLSGSLWVPIILHFAIDASNVLVFRITGKDGLFEVDRPVDATERARYRVLYGVLMAALLLGWYGTSVRVEALSSQYDASTASKRCAQHFVGRGRTAPVPSTGARPAVLPREG